MTALANEPIEQLIPWDSARYLTTPEIQAEYLAAAIEEDGGDGKNIARALGVLARAQGMSGLAETAGVNRQALYKSLSGKGAPSLATLLRVTRALGMELTARPKPATPHAAPPVSI